MSNNEGWSMVPRDSDHAWQMAQSISKSGMCPNVYAGKPADIMIAAAMGQKLGLDVFAALLGIAVINGRPSIWGDALRAIILSHPELEDLEEHYEGEDASLTAVCTITRKGMTPHTDTFSVKDAKDAGLWGQRTWKSFARDMLLNRAFGRAARRRFADALNGIHVAEEMQDAEQVRNVSSTVVGDGESTTFSIPETVEVIEHVQDEEIVTDKAEDVLNKHKPAGGLLPRESQQDHDQELDNVPLGTEEYSDPEDAIE